MEPYNQKPLQELLQKHKLDFVVLFGSFAKGQTKKISDLDIAIKSAKPISIEEYTELTHQLSQTFNVLFQNIDLVVIERKTSPLLLQQIAKNGIFLGGNSLKFKEFQLYALRKFFDTKKFRDLTKRYIKQNLYAK